MRVLHVQNEGRVAPECDAHRTTEDGVADPSGEHAELPSVAGVLPDACSGRVIRLLTPARHILSGSADRETLDANQCADHAPAVPTAMYGLNLLCAAVAYSILTVVITRLDGANSRLKRAIGRDRKGTASIVLYVLGIASAFYHPWLAAAFCTLVALIWLVPDTRIERTLHAQAGEVRHSREAR